MSENPSTNIWRNIAAIPTTLVVGWVGMYLIEIWIMSFLQGEDPENDKFLFFIPIQPIAIWVIPFFQHLLIPGISVYACALMATSKQTYFAVAAATLVVVLTLCGVILFTFGTSGVPGVVMFRVWLWTLIGWVSVAVALLAVFEEHKERQGRN